MSPVRYNPLAYSEKLKENGMSEKLANVIAQQQAEFASGINNESLASKDDISGIKSDIRTILSEMKSEFKIVREEMKSEFKLVREEMKSLELRMTIKLGTIMLAGIGLMTFLFKHT